MYVLQNNKILVYNNDVFMKHENLLNLTQIISKFNIVTFQNFKWMPFKTFDAKFQEGGF